MDPSDDLAPVIPLRSDEEELVLLESAVLDQLDDEDARQAGAAEQTAGPDDNVEWLARHDPPGRRPPPCP